MPNALLTFVDLKDPFFPTDIEDEPAPGPVLSILSAKPFHEVHLFHTPQAADNADATACEVRSRHGGCFVSLHPLPVSDPKDYSAIMGALGRRLAEMRSQLKGKNCSVCVSSGTAEMRAAWFLLQASGRIHAVLLQVGSPAEPLFGAAAVREVSLGGGDWGSLRDLVMPLDYFVPPEQEEPDNLLSGVLHGMLRSPIAPREEPERHTELDDALLELGFQIYSPGMRLLVERAANVANNEEAILIHGESGTGKELVARLIHRLSSRRGRQMVTVNCAAIPEELAESHLFGHVKGAFTGAGSASDGIFRAAHGSTLFLDEIAELKLSCQAKLLRAIQFGDFAPVGTTRTVRVDVRVIAATHRSLASEVERGAFRQDLYYRLNVLPLEIPPLRERPNEIVDLALDLLKRINARRQHPRQISKEALRRLERHSWPGNVRELDSVLRRSVAFATGPVLRAEDILIDRAPSGPDPLASLPQPHPNFKLADFLSKVRTHLILRALDSAGGNQAAAAALLGISKQALSKFLKGNRG